MLTFKHFLIGRIVLKSFISSLSLNSGNDDSKAPSEIKKSFYTDGFSKSRKNKRTANSTPSKFCTQRNINLWLVPAHADVGEAVYHIVTALKAGMLELGLASLFSHFLAVRPWATYLFSVNPLPQLQVGRIVLAISSG